MYIPGLEQLAQSLRDTDFFGRFVQTSLMFAIVMMIYVTFKAVPYGKNYTPGTSLLRCELPDRLAVILINLPGPLIFAYAILRGPQSFPTITSIPTLLYLGHYVHRALIYPWFRSTKSNPWPLESVIYFFATNFIVGYSCVGALLYGGVKRHMAVQILLAVLFVACAVVAGIHDYRLCALRLAGPKGYQIPKGLLFTWISGPNYAFELLQWIAYIFFLPFGWPMAVVGMWLAVNITGRAEANHEAYVKKIFKSKYPDERCPYVPFVKNSRYVL